MLHVHQRYVQHRSVADHWIPCRLPVRRLVARMAAPRPPGRFAGPRAGRACPQKAAAAVRLSVATKAVVPLDASAAGSADRGTDSRNSGQREHLGSVEHPSPLPVIASPGVTANIESDASRAWPGLDEGSPGERRLRQSPTSLIRQPPLTWNKSDSPPSQDKLATQSHRISSAEISEVCEPSPRNHSLSTLRGNQQAHRIPVSGHCRIQRMKKPRHSH